MTGTIQREAELKEGGKPEGAPEEKKTRGRGAKVKMCYSCAEYVPADAEQCPKCGAGPAKFNPAWVLRVVVGFLIGFFLWLFFMN